MEDCAKYRNYYDILGVVDQSQSTDAGAYNGFVNTCQYLIGTYGITQDELLTWNPSLSAGNCTMQLGSSYCVGMNNTTDDCKYMKFASKRCLVRD